VAVAPARHSAAEAGNGHRAGQAVTAEDLFTQHRRRIYAYCLRWLRSPEEAEDAVQTTYLRAWRSLNDGGEPYNPLSWLYEIARNVCVRSLEGRSRRGTLVPLDDETASEEPSRARDELFGLGDALVRMPERQRRALLLREWRGLSYKEIAKEMGLSASAVETLLFRSRRSLAAELEQPCAPRRARMPSFVALLDGLRSAIPQSVSASMATGLAVVTATALSPTLFHRDLAPRPQYPSAGGIAAVLASPDALPSFDGRALASIAATGGETGRAHGQVRTDPSPAQGPANASGQNAAPASGTGSMAPDNQGSGSAVGVPTPDTSAPSVDAPGQGSPAEHPPGPAPAQAPDEDTHGGYGATPATPAIPAIPGHYGAPTMPATPATPATPPSHSSGHKDK
jgi:RNA polymerase sigma-70 factor (ECF subfamily)